MWSIFDTLAKESPSTPPAKTPTTRQGRHERIFHLPTAPTSWPLFDPSIKSSTAHTALLGKFPTDGTPRGAIHNLVRPVRAAPPGERTPPATCRGWRHPSCECAMPPFMFIGASSCAQMVVVHPCGYVLPGFARSHPRLQSCACAKMASAVVGVPHTSPCGVPPLRAPLGEGSPLGEGGPANPPCVHWVQRTTSE